MSIQYDEEQTESSALGSNIYGGRPTFALIRKDRENEVEVTLYELLPTKQADARRRRLERRRRQASKITPIENIIDEDVNGFDDWTWEDWVAVKIRRLTGARLRSLIPLLDEVLRETEVDPSRITGTGDSTILLHEGPGIRLSIGFIGIKPLRRVDKMRTLARGISRMSLEECYYWHAKCRSPDITGGSKALRTLLTENTN